MQWRLKITLASAASLVAGGIGCHYIVGVDLTHVSGLVHWHLPHDALLLLIITLGIVAIVLGWRAIVYLERRDQHHHEIISDMQDQEGVYQRYENGSSMFTRWPAARPSAREGQNRPGADQPRRQSSPSRADKDRRRHVVPLDGRQRAAPRPPRKRGIAGPYPGQDASLPAQPDGKSGQSPSPKPHHRSA